MTIRHCDTLINEGIMALAVEGWQDLIRRGVCDDNALVQWNHKAFVAEEDGRPIGILTYEPIEWTRSWSVVLGYVQPWHRGKGTYRALWEALVAKAREEKQVNIDGTTMVENREMQEVMGKLGRELRSLTYRYRL